MQVKKYHAKTIKAAIHKVKNVLGPEAMIISTKKVRRNSGNHLFEVAAAPAGYDVSVKSTKNLGDIRSELMSIKEMIYLLNHSGESWRN